jgi:hypothetical protein
MGIFPQSIRWRIQLWYLLLLAVIIAALLAAFHRNQREIKYQVLDRELSNPITRLLPSLERTPGISSAWSTTTEAGSFGGF